MKFKNEYFYSIIVLGACVQGLVAGAAGPL